MAHIKVYQKIDPRFNNTKLLREARVIRNDMGTLMESWHSYTSSEFINEGLQDQIVQKIQKMSIEFANKLRLRTNKY